MSVGSLLSLYGFWLFILLMIVFALLLGLFIVKLVRLAKKDPILNLPVAGRQDVTFPAAGRVHLCREGPRWELWVEQTYELLAEDGSLVNSWKLILQARTVGTSRIRWEKQAFDLPQPGRYTLLVHGLGENTENANQHRIVFIKPGRAQMVGYILGIVFSALFLAGSLVGFLLGLVNSSAVAG